MAEGADHRVGVDAWMARAAAGAPPERLVQVFEEGFGVLWRRAHRTLGDVTLVAILDRVLHYATEKFPMMSVVKAEPGGLRCQVLRENIEGVPSEQVEAAFRFVMVEFLTVLGNLTADVLTPFLHAALSDAAREDGGVPDQDGSAAEDRDRGLKNGEDAKR